MPKAEAALESKSIVPEMPASPLPPPTDYQFPTVLYNGGINPAVPFAIRGAIWYQGEGNAGELGTVYLNKLKALAGGWRLKWGQGDFPFYIVQLPNYGKPHPDEPGGEPICYSWSGIQEAQFLALSQIPNTGLAVTIDIGTEIDLHTKNKQDTGARLAAWALANEYGRKDMVFCGPIYKGFKIEGDKIRILFDHVGSGLMMGRKNGLEPVVEVKDDKLRQFSIVGEDKVWKWADAVIDGDTIVVSNPEVKNPIAVRFAFTSNPVGFNLYNKEGFPASPFRTQFAGPPDGKKQGEVAGVIPYAKDTIKLDGETDDWGDISKTAPLIKLDDFKLSGMGDGKKWSGPDDLSAKFYVAWNEKGLYWLLLVKDDHPLGCPDDLQPYESDAVEIFFDGRSPEMQQDTNASEGTVQMVVSPALDGKKSKYYLRPKNQNPETVTKKLPDGYVLEGFIPFDKAVFPAGEWKPERAVKLAFHILDHDDPALLGKDGDSDFAGLEWGASWEDVNVKNNQVTYADTSGWKILILKK